MWGSGLRPLHAVREAAVSVYRIQASIKLVRKADSSPLFPAKSSLCPIGQIGSRDPVARRMQRAN